MSTATALVPVAPSVAISEQWLAGEISSQTQRAYLTDLADFHTWLATADPSVSLARGVTRDHIIAYRNEMAERRGLSAATIARRLSCLRQFFDYTVGEGHYERNPARLVKGYRVSDLSPRVALEDAQVRALLAQPDRATRKGTRDYAMLMLFTHLGLRNAELATLPVAAIGEERGHKTLRVQGKGRKQRLLPMPPHVFQAVADWLACDGRPLGADTCDVSRPLFHPMNDRSGKHENADHPLNGRSILRLVRGYAARAGLRAIDVHTLRHTAATAALDGGASVRHAQAMLGHADPKTTMRYDSRRGNLDESAVYKVHYT